MENLTAKNPDIEIIKYANKFYAQLFKNYVEKIVKRCECSSHRSQLWEDFPCDLWTDRENWMMEDDILYIKEYIDFIKEWHPVCKKSAVEFWQHWLRYKNNFVNQLNLNNYLLSMTKQ